MYGIDKLSRSSVSRSGLKSVGLVLGGVVLVGLLLLVGGIESGTRDGENEGEEVKVDDGEDEGNREGHGVTIVDGELVVLLVCTVVSEVVMFVILGVGDNDAEIGAVVWLEIELTGSSIDITDGWDVVPADSESVGGGGTVVKGAMVGVKTGLPVINGGNISEDWNISSVELESVG